MITASTNSRAMRSSKRTAVAVLGCVFGVGLIAFALSAGTTSKSADSSPDKTSAAQHQRKKQLPAWNMALGDVVVLAKDLGFEINSGEDSDLEQDKVAARIETQLQKLRGLYREESEKKPRLMGAMVLQLSVNSAGEVTEVKETISRLEDPEFKKTVIAEISNWTFAEVLTQAITIRCPLMFVREGMEITTLVHWEKSFGLSDDKLASVTLNAQQTRPVMAKDAEAPVKAAAAPPSKQKPTVQPAQASRQSIVPDVSASTLYQIRYPTSIRKEPNFSSASVASFTNGTKVAVIAKQGDWLQVRYPASGQTGYIRKEFLTAVEMARR